MRQASVVLDTNIVVSAHLNEDGLERFVLDLTIARKLQLFLSSEILEEYRGVLQRKKLGINPAQADRSLQTIQNAAEWVQPRHKLNVTRDADDNKFLECSSEAKADYLVTGNKRHFPNRWEKTQVVNARELLEQIIPELQR